MKDKKTLKATLVALGVLGAASLAGCASMKPEDKIGSLKEGLSYIASNKNYAFGFSNDGEPGVDYYFTENFIGRDGSAPTMLDGYIQDDSGIYPIKNNDVYLPGEYVLNDDGDNLRSIWNVSFIHTMYKVGLDYIDTIEDDADSITISDKDYKLSLIQTFGYETTDILSLESVTASYVNETVRFALSWGKKGRTFYTLKDCGVASAQHFEEFKKKNGKAFTPNRELTEFRRLLKLDNFVQPVYDIYSEGYTMNQHFTNRYFASYPLSNTNAITGYMGVKHTSTGDGDYNLNGCYYFYYNSEAGDYKINPTQMFSKPDITEFYHYPKYMSLLNNLQFLEEGELKNANYEDPLISKKYYTKDLGLVMNFAKNFSLDQTWDFLSCPPEALAIEIKLKEADENSSIIFHYLFRNGKDEYDYLIPCMMFGKANIARLDTIWETLNN